MKRVVIVDDAIKVTSVEAFAEAVDALATARDEQDRRMLLRASLRVLQCVLNETARLVGKLVRAA